MSGADLVGDLHHAVTSGRFSLRILPATSDLAEWSWREIEVRTKDGIWICPVDDEYGDAETRNPTAWLHLILASLDLAAEEADPKCWAVAAGLGDASFAAALHHRLRDLIGPLRTRLGPGLRPVPAQDIEFNRGPARLLRSLIQPPASEPGSPRPPG